RAKKDHDFAGKVREAGKTDRSKYAKSKGEPSEGHDLGETAEFVENQGVCSLAQFSSDRKQQRDGKTVSKYQHQSASRGEDRGTGDAEEDVPHVHHARVT